jgi:hypothetical protein
MEARVHRPGVLAPPPFGVLLSSPPRRRLRRASLFLPRPLPLRHPLCSPTLLLLEMERTKTRGGWMDGI